MTSPPSVDAASPSQVELSRSLCEARNARLSLRRVLAARNSRWWARQALIPVPNRRQRDAVILRNRQRAARKPPLCPSSIRRRQSTSPTFVVVSIRTI